MIHSNASVASSHQLGKLVRTARKQQGLTQQELAGLCGVGTRFVGDLERGKESCELGKTLLVIKMLGITLIAEMPGHE